MYYPFNHPSHLLILTFLRRDIQELTLLGQQQLQTWLCRVTEQTAVFDTLGVRTALWDGNGNNVWVILNNWETVFERHTSVEFFFFPHTNLLACLDTSRGESFYCLHYVFNAHSHHFLSSSFGSHQNVALKLCCPDCTQSNLAKWKSKVKTKKQFQPALST